MSTELISLPDRSRINWPSCILFAILHAGTVAALFFFNWHALAVALFLYWMCTGLGISLGYHRLHTHRSYKTPVWVEYFFAVCGALTFEGGPIFWVATHRIHHQKSDQPGDPHSPRDGAWWAHIIWMMVGEATHANTPLMAKYAPDLAKHKFYVWLDRWFWTLTVALGVLLFALGGWPYVFWGVFVRITFGLHATWLVNSATHLWGARRFNTKDDSRNNLWVALITFGEGWHNNHHAHPTSARHGLAWWEFDLSWITLNVMKVFGLARSIHVAKLPEAKTAKQAA